VAEAPRRVHPAFDQPRRLISLDELRAACH
jgi:hypothetical protein